MSTGKHRFREGDCWGNIVAEIVFGTLKLELVFWEKYITDDHAKRSIVDYIEMFYNSNRRYSYLDNISPMEYERKWFLKKAVSEKIHL